MQLGMVGLGRMGSNMARRLLANGHQVTVYDMDLSAGQRDVKMGATGASSLSELAGTVSPPRAVWVMVPAGQPTDETIEALSRLLSSGDTVLDGGNSYYKDSMRRGYALAQMGIHFMDVGTSGGVWGLKEGYCLMVGGADDEFKRMGPVFLALAASGPGGYANVGPVGSGHFVKMVHNGIEYGMMQSLAEGMSLLRAKKEFPLDLRQIAELWQHGSVLRSWLLELAAGALSEDPGLEHVQAYVEDSGEGRWTAQEAIELGVPLPAITLALAARFRSRQEQPFADRLLAALRHKFGGHQVRKA